MTRGLNAENYIVKYKEKPMVSPHVSDSEDELETDSLWALSSERLEELLRQKFTQNSAFKPTYTVSNLIHIYQGDLVNISAGNP